MTPIRNLATVAATPAATALAAAAIIATSSPAAAQSLTTNPAVEIKNNSGETRKICLHKDARISLLPRDGCITLKTGRSFFWDRKGKFTPFKVKVYKKRKAIDKYLYARDLPNDTGKLIIGTGGRFGFSRFKNIRTKYSLQACNSKRADTVWLALGYQTNYGNFGHGWWGLKRGECITIAVSEKMKENWNIPYGTAPNLYYYARTFGENPLFWSGGHQANTFCHNPNKQFKATVASSGSCQSGLKAQSYRRVDSPTAGRNLFQVSF